MDFCIKIFPFQFFFSNTNHDTIALDFFAMNFISSIVVKDYLSNEDLYLSTKDLFIKHIPGKTNSYAYVTRDQEYQVKAFELVFAFAIINCKKVKSIFTLFEAMLSQVFSDSEEKKIIANFQIIETIF